MAVYKTDLRDIYFNLCDFLEVHKNDENYEEADIKSIVGEFDKFVGNEVWPAREHGDREGVKFVDGKVVTPECFKSLNRKFFENGLYGIGYPEEIGGTPAPHSLTVGCLSLLTGANTAYSIFTELTRGAQNIFIKLGTDKQKEMFIPKMMSGQWSGTMCLTEAGAGSDVGNLRSTATPTGDGKYKISGVKLFVSAGENDIYENIVHLVLARTPGANDGTRGISLFAVPKFRVNEDGSVGEFNDVCCNKIEEKMGIHASPTCELVFGENNNCIGEIIGNECEGMANMFLMMNEVRLYCGIQGDAQGNLVYQLTEQYARERTQFKTEIMNLPDVKRMLLKMRAQTRGMRALNLYTSDLFDREERGEDCSAEIALLTPICKAYCTDEGFNVSVDAIQVHGGYGYCSEYGIEQFARDSKVAAIYEGTNGVQALDFVTRKVLKDGGKALMNLAGKVSATISDPKCREWKEELGLLKISLEKTQDILEVYAGFARDKKMAPILGSSVDFLNYCARIIISWILLDHAIKAKGMLESADDGEEKKYLQSKIDDYKIYTHHYLAMNAGTFQTIRTFCDDWDQYEV